MIRLTTILTAVSALFLASCACKTCDKSASSCSSCDAKAKSACCSKDGKACCKAGHKH